MATNSPELKNISSSSKLNFEFEDDFEENDEKKTFQLIRFFIFIFFTIVILFATIIALLYNLIIKPEKLKSNRYLNPEIYSSLRERYKITEYVEQCINGIILDNKKYPKAENPNISIIIPVYNKDKFILRVLRSIQNQSLKNIEIIFIDDFSYDNSSKLIEEYKKEDERIVLLKHEKNKGTLISRIDGAKNAKGEYILFIDPDDLLVQKEFLEDLYAKGKTNNIDVIQFQLCEGDFYKSFYCKNTNRTINPIYQPELSNLMYYENGYLHQSEFFICGKLIKREIFLEVINSIDKYYLNQHMILHEDGLTLFILLKKAKSYMLVKDYGMLYFSNKYSTLSNTRNKDRINKTIRDCFLYLEFMFNYTNNTLYEKNMAVEQFKFLIRQFNDVFQKATNGFKYIYKVIDLYLNCDIIVDEDKKIIKEIKKQFIFNKNNLTKKGK